MTISILIFSTVLIATRAWRAHAREGLNPLICGSPTDRCTVHATLPRNMEHGTGGEAETHLTRGAGECTEERAGLEDGDDVRA